MVISASYKDLLKCCTCIYWVLFIAIENLCKFKDKYRTSTTSCKGLVYLLQCEYSIEIYFLKCQSRSFQQCDIFFVLSNL